MFFLSVIHCVLYQNFCHMWQGFTQRRCTNNICVILYNHVFVWQLGVSGEEIIQCCSFENFPSRFFDNFFEKLSWSKSFFILVFMLNSLLFIEFPRRKIPDPGANGFLFTSVKTIGYVPNFEYVTTGF